MLRHLLAAALALAPVTLTAQSAQTQTPPPPKLLVVISVDQFSADLFAEYRPYWTGGMRRLGEGAVFPSGYQSHAATETCPGHSTILTGDHPARTGIIANNWIDQNATRAAKDIYCAEDETLAASSKSGVYVPSVAHLRVPTLGDRMKAANPASRVVAVAGKDRAAIMMGGHATDAIWFLNPVDYASFISLPGRTPSAAVTRANATIATAVARAKPDMPLSPLCATHSRAVAISSTKSVGTGRFGRAAGDKRAFRVSPESDVAVLDLAGALIDEMRLGRGPATDLIAIGASATDPVGHAYGTEGSEMCLQLAALDAALGKFFDRLDRARIDYAVVLTADHGGHDAPERNVQDALPDAQRVDAALSPQVIGAKVAQELGLSGSVLVGAEAAGDVWLAKSLAADKRASALARARALYLAHRQVAAVFTGDELAATPAPTLPADMWSLAERARASYTAGRSGDLIVMLKPRVTPITAEDAGKGYIATHGSPWNYDRRVPILFWRKGMAGFEQPNSVETVDIAPTLAAMIGLPVPTGEMDGRCLDLVVGEGTNCR